MIRNGKDITTPQKAQVCVIGSGPAGITAAWELSQAGLKVILLDAGRELNYKEENYYQQSWEDKAKLYNGVADGNFSKNESDFLIRPQAYSDYPSERERVYGGTSTHWGGQCRPLGAITFEKRPGFPGWPITRQDLDPYYEKAVTLNHLYGPYFNQDGRAGYNFTAEFWASEMNKRNLKAVVPCLNDFDAEMYQFMDPKWMNFAIRSFDEKGTTIGDSAVDVIVNATLLNIVEQGGSVRHLKVASMDDDPQNPQKATEFTVTADLYILACGAVANARQLLLSGIGNELVGHYFMCHPLSQGQIIRTTQETYLSDAERNLMIDRFDLMKEPNWSDLGINGTGGRFTTKENTARRYGIGRCWFWANWGQMYFEMAPNCGSYVGLDKTQKDPVFQQQRTHIHWAFSDVDKKTYETNCSLFNEASSKFSSIISWPRWEDLADQWVVNGHHIGTTRMATSAGEGVVDQNLKVHGVDNLYVAGASVFASTGISNPTMTIITLSIRLAEHIYKDVIKPRARVSEAQ